MDVPSYLSKIRDGDLVGAARILLNFNPLSSNNGESLPPFSARTTVI
ncbi:unnamed protein product, partial [marine sediment metagenome]